MDGGGNGNHWEALKEPPVGLQVHHQASIDIGDGTTTAFWWDFWLEGASLAQRFPCLLNRCTVQEASVQEVRARSLLSASPVPLLPGNSGEDGGRRSD